MGIEDIDGKFIISKLVDPLDIDIELAEDTEASLQKPKRSQRPRVTKGFAIDPSRASLFDSQGRRRWKAPGGNLDDNLALGMRQVQDAFLTKYPEIAQRFPLDEQGTISIISRTDAEKFILEKAEEDEELRAVLLGPTGRQLYPAVYKSFGNSTVFTVSISFGEWGLFGTQLQEFLGKRNIVDDSRKKLDQKPPYFIEIRENNTAQGIFATPTDQITGRRLLPQLLSGGINITDLNPIYITDLREHNGVGALYIGTALGDNPTISLNERTYEAYRTYGALVLLADTNRKLGYQWMNVFAAKSFNAVDLNEPLHSIRINQATRQFETVGWFGPERQAFFDYIYEKIKLKSPEELPEFKCNVSSNGVYLGRYEGRNYVIPLHGLKNNSLREVVVKPRFSNEHGYFWLEGYPINDNLRTKPLFSRRIIYENETENHFKMIDWKGCQIQSLVDCIYGRLPASNFKPFEFLLDPDLKVPNLYLEGSALMLQLHSIKDRKKPILVTFKEYSSYRYIDVYQEGEEIYSALVSYDPEGKPKLNGSWPGIGRQLIMGYLDHVVNSEDFQKIEGTLNVNKTVYICKYKGKDLNITLRTTAFREGEKVTIVPAEGDQGELILYVYKEGADQPSAKSVFNQDTGTLTTKTLEMASKKPDGYWTPERLTEQADKFYRQYGDLSSDLLLEKDSSLCSGIFANYPGGLLQLRRDRGMNQANASGVFTDSTGSNWASLLKIAGLLGISYNRVIDVASSYNLTSLLCYGGNGKKSAFYKIEDIRMLLAPDSSGKGLSNIDSGSADEWLKNLLQED